MELHARLHGQPLHARIAARSVEEPGFARPRNLRTQARIVE
jgi:hypothetical protein